MPSDPQYDIRVRGGGSPNGGYMSLSDLLDAVFGHTPGLFPERTLTGWGGIALPHFMVRPLTGVVATTGGAIAGFAPNEGGPIIILRAAVVVQVASTGAATLDVGVGATATTTDDTLIDGCDVHTAANVSFDNVTNPGTNGLAGKYMSASQFITVTGSADTTGLSGFIYVVFIKI